MTDIDIPLTIGGQSALVRIRFLLEHTLDIWEARIVKHVEGSGFCDVAPAPDWVVQMIERDFVDGGPVFDAVHRAHIQRINLTQRIKEATP